MYESSGYLLRQCAEPAASRVELGLRSITSTLARDGPLLARSVYKPSVLPSFLKIKTVDIEIKRTKLNIGSTMSKPAVYLGTFIHSKSLTEIDILNDAAIFVDEQGKIVAIEKDIKDVDGALSVCPKLGWETDEVIARACGREQFFFPGFIGLSLKANISHRCDFEVQLLTYIRYTHPCKPVSQCWNLWQIYSLGLAEHLYLPARIITLLPNQGQESLLTLYRPHSVQRHHHSRILRHHLRPQHQPPRRSLPRRRPASLRWPLLHGSHVT